MSEFDNNSAENKQIIRQQIDQLAALPSKGPYEPKHRRIVNNFNASVMSTAIRIFGSKRYTSGVIDPAGETTHTLSYFPGEKPGESELGVASIGDSARVGVLILEESPESSIPNAHIIDYRERFGLKKLLINLGTALLSVI